MGSGGAPLVLGIDSSTQSTKAELRRLDTGDLVASGRGTHPPTAEANSRPGLSEQDPEAWWAALRKALEPLAEHLPGVCSVSVAGQQHGLVMLDINGTPLRAAKLWNDTESAPQAAAMLSALGPSAWAGAVGSVPVASFTVTKLAWVAEHEPDLLDRAAHLLLPHDYLTFRLLGGPGRTRPVTDRGDASGTGWWSPGDREYRPDLLEAIGLDPALVDRFPRVLGPLDVAGEIGDNDLGLPPSALVAPGTGDNMAGALGIGLGVGDVAVSLGTSGTAYAASATPTADTTGAVAGFADATGRYLPLIATLNATKVSNWMANVLGLDAPSLAALALEAAPGSDGTVLVPYLDGERTPNRPTATGRIVGLRTSTSRAVLARAAHEGVVCGLLDGVDSLANAGVQLDGRMLLIGGGARSAAYRAVVADLADLPVVVPDIDEAVAAGACVQAAAVHGQQDPMSIATTWRLDAGASLPPAGDHRHEIRAAYAAAADYRD